MEQNNEINSIFIGSKPLTNYVTGIIMQFNSSGVNEVLVKARGKFTSKAIDIVELTKRKFTKENITSDNIKLGSEEFITKEGKKITVSTMEIILKKE